MELQEIKKLCNSDLDCEDDYFNIRVYRQALSIALEQLQSLASYETNENSWSLAVMKQEARCRAETIKKLFD